MITQQDFKVLHSLGEHGTQTAWRREDDLPVFDFAQSAVIGPI